MRMTHEEVAQYHRDGFLLVDNLFDADEVKRMILEVEEGDRVANTTRGSLDQTGKVSRLAIWHELGSDLWSRVSICPRLVNNIRILLGQDAAFFHGKVMLKEAQSGGAWEWHQDYGYWYNQGFFYPHMMSVFIALDPATRANGCLQVLRGSHLLGRLDHTTVGQQTGADPARIRQIEQSLETVHVEMSSGSALFFHSNLLHSSAPNESDQHRRSFIVCYNAVGNPQIREGQLVQWESCPVGSDDLTED